MGKKKKSDDRPAPFVGSALHGSIPGGWDCVRCVVQHPALCTPGQWAALGRPVAVIRYGLGYRDDSMYGHTYCHTGVDPTGTVAALVVTPSNCRSIDVGIVTPAGAYWLPAKIMQVSDDGAAKDYVRRRTGMVQPIYYWDYGLNEDNVARYLTTDGDVVATPQMDPGSEPDDPAALLRLADDGSPLAADPVPPSED